MSDDRCGIYQIQCVVSGKSYVGSSKHIRRRWADHRRQLRLGTHRSPRLQQAWNKHGEDKFVFSILEECDRAVLFDREQHHIDAKKRDYNSMPRVRVFTKEMRAKARASLLAFYADITHCPAGHEYTPENTSFMRNEVRTRLCKECARIRTRKAIEAETPEQKEKRLARGREYHQKNFEYRVKQMAEYRQRTREKKCEYDRLHLAEKRARRLKARAEGRAYG